MSVETEKLCVVAGDVTLDWNIMHCETGKLEIADFGGIRACWQRGGAALLADVISNLARSLPDSVRVINPKAPTRAVAPGEPGHRHAFAM